MWKSMLKTFLKRGAEMEDVYFDNKKSEAEEIWRQILDCMKGKLTALAFETWFGSAKPLGVNQNKIVVEVPNEFYIDWIEEHYGELIEEAKEVLGFKNLKITLRPSPRREEIKLQEKKLVQRPETGLSTRYSFENFVVGKSNEFAYAAAKAVANAPALHYNPLFILGGVGLGKTHLLHAIGNFITKNRKSYKVFYTPAENFMNEMIHAIQKRKMFSFKNKYRQLDVLLIDDIQFLADKEMLQEEIFHTFNSLYDAGKQIVMTADRPPREIPTLQERLVSRFQWGLVVDIKPPDLETRMAILKKKADEEKVSVPDEVIHYIAQRVKKNIRELEGCLRRVIAYHIYTKKEITLETTEEILKDMIKEGKGLGLDELVEVVSRLFNVNEKEVRGKTRKAEIVLARQVAMYLSRKILGVSLKRIGSFFGGRDHSTVLHSIEKVENLVKTDEEFSRKVKKIMEELRNR